MKAASHNRLFAGVPEAERERFASFVGSHSVREIDHGSRRVRFLSGGSGNRTILILTAAHGTPSMLYDTVLRLESDYRVVVVDVGDASSLDSLTSDVDRVLEAEGVGRVVAFGQSICGILAQAYLMRGASRVDALVLAQTLAPRRENNRLAALWILRVLPGPLLRAVMSWKLRRLPTPQLAPEDAARRAMSRALLLDAVSTTLTKKRLMSTVHLVLEFNREESYGVAANGAWQGRVLLITSEDDAGFGDVERISRALPHTEVHVLPGGAGHSAPLAHRNEFFGRIEGFLSSL